MKIDYLQLLQALGPMPRLIEVARFLFGNENYYKRVYTLIHQGELEAIKPAGQMRIILNSLVEYLERRADSIPKQESWIKRDKEILARLGNGSTATGGRAGS
jgi:hypothetical protein